MFWGLIMEPNKRYTQTVEKSFHVSMASLDLPISDDNWVQVMLCYENRSYLLCNLKKSSAWQVPLDLNFQEGTKIAFTCNGHGHVHLTGYLIPDEDLDLDELEEEEDEEVPQLVGKQSKRKAMDSLKHEKNVKRCKQEIETESSDEDIELDGLNEENDSENSEEGDETFLKEEEEDSDEEEEGEEDEDDEEEKAAKSQQKDKKNKQQQQVQQEKKKDKKKLVNGKEVKQEQQQNKQEKNKEHQQNEQNVQSDKKKRKLEGGVQIEEINIGTGTPVKSGKFVTVYYVGRLKNGKKFDSTTQGTGFKFRLGKGEVIKGWDIGIVGMKVGGKRRITIPPAMAYGAKGSPPVIPGNSTLVFEVELKNVH
ncbi:39 kDa FK506-binding nuclear protein [Anthophora quadrimaculata]